MISEQKIKVEVVHRPDDPESEWKEEETPLRTSKLSKPSSIPKLSSAPIDTPKLSNAPMDTPKRSFKAKLEEKKKSLVEDIAETEFDEILGKS